MWYWHGFIFRTKSTEGRRGPTCRTGKALKLAEGCSRDHVFEEGHRILGGASALVLRGSPLNSLRSGLSIYNLLVLLVKNLFHFQYRLLLA